MNGPESPRCLAAGGAAGRDAGGSGDDGADYAIVGVNDGRLCVYENCRFSTG